MQLGPHLNSSRIRPAPPRAHERCSRSTVAPTIHVRWSKATFISDATKFVIDPADNFNTACSAHSLALSKKTGRA